jgi:hypothetical protein
VTIHKDKAICHDIARDFYAEQKALSTRSQEIRELKKIAATKYKFIL